MATTVSTLLLLAATSLVYSAPVHLLRPKSINAGSFVRILDWTHGKFMAATSDDTLTLEYRHRPNTCFRLLQNPDGTSMLETLQDEKVLKITSHGKVFVGNELELLGSNPELIEESGSGANEGSANQTEVTVYEKLTATIGFERRVIRAYLNPSCALQYDTEQRIFRACTTDPDYFHVLRAPECLRWIQ